MLQFDDDATAYLLGLGADKPRRPRRRPRKKTVPPGIAKLLETLPLPAFVEGRDFDVLAANPLAAALSPRLAPRGGRQPATGCVPRPAERAFYPDWDLVTGDLG